MTIFLCLHVLSSFKKLVLWDWIVALSLLTYLLHGAVVLLEKLTGFQLKKFPIFYGTRRFITSHKCQTSLPILSQLNPVHTPTSHFLKIHLNIILSSMPGSSNWSLSFRSPHQNPVYISPLPHMCHMPRPSHSSRFYHPNNMGWRVQIIKLLIM